MTKISFITFLFRNIYYYWEEKDYLEIKKYIPFKFFNFEKLDSSLSFLIDNKYSLGKLDEVENEIKIDKNIKDSKIEEKKESKNYFKFNYSMPIVGNALYKFIKEEDNFKSFEDFMKTSTVYL